MITNQPTIYNSPTIYNAGGGEKEKVVSEPPSGTYFIEYIEQRANQSGDGYFSFDNAGTLIEFSRNDHIFLKFAMGDTLGYNCSLFSATSTQGNAGIIDFTLYDTNRFQIWNGGNSNEYNMYNGITPITLSLQYVRKTLNMFYTSFGDFYKAARTEANREFFQFARFVNPLPNAISRLYRFFITDENEENIKYDFYPIYDGNTSKLAYWEKITNQIFYPTNQNGKTAGGKIIY